MTTKIESDHDPDSVAHVYPAVVRAERFVEHRYWAPAYDTAVGVLDELARLEVDSAHVRLLAAIAGDSMGRLADAVIHIVRARALDPASPRILSSEGIILDRVVGLLSAFGPNDAEAQAVVDVVRRHYGCGHAAIERIDDTLAEMKDRTLADAGHRRFQA